MFDRKSRVPWSSIILNGKSDEEYAENDILFLPEEFSFMARILSG